MSEGKGQQAMEDNWSPLEFQLPDGKDALQTAQKCYHDRDNDQPLYKTRPRQAKHREITREDVEKFWRPIWEDMENVKLDAVWINTVLIPSKNRYV